MLKKLCLIRPNIGFPFCFSASIYIGPFGGLYKSTTSFGFVFFGISVLFSVFTRLQERAQR
jgi:hypothetical protein